MIFYMSDWDKYPNAVADTSTKQITWVRYCALLKSMGIKNHLWPISLMDPSLRGVDPFNPDLTSEQKIAIALECKRNPIYFLREVVRIKAGGGLINLRMNRALGAMFFLFYSCIDFGIVIQRQQGKTTGCDALRLDYLWLRAKRSESFLYTKDAKLRAKNIRAVKEMRDNVPSYIIPVSKDDADNTEVLECKELGNIMWSAVGNKDPEQARKVARGNAVRVTHTDEAPYIPNVHFGLPSLLTAASTERANAKAAGQIYCNILSTTPGILGTEEGDYCYNLIHSGWYYNEHIMDCKDADEARELVLAGAKTRRVMVNITLSHRQLGITDEEQIRIVAETGNNKEDEINRDLYNVWLRGNTESNPLSKQLLAVIRSAGIDPIWTECSDDNYVIRWYRSHDDVARLMRGYSIVAGLDSAEVVGRDGNVLIIIDIRTMEVIGTSIVNVANLHHYSLWLKNFLLKYGNVVLIPERKSSAMSIIDTVAAFMIEEKVNPFTRIFNYIANSPYDFPKEFEQIRKFDFYRGHETYAMLKKHMGFMTTGGSRQHLYSAVLREATESTGHLTRDKNLVYELCDLREKNNRVDHAAGGHDDHVISWLLVHWFVRHAKNLNFYCIDELMALSMVSDKGALLTEEELAKRRLLSALNQEITLIKERLMSATTSMDRMRFETILKSKVAEAVGLGETTYTLDSIMREVGERQVNRSALREAVARHNSKRYG